MIASRLRTSRTALSKFPGAKGRAGQYGDWPKEIRVAGMSTDDRLKLAFAAAYIEHRADTFSAEYTERPRL